MPEKLNRPEKCLLGAILGTKITAFSHNGKANRLSVATLSTQARGI
jgi:hypothetical protein